MIKDNTFIFMYSYEVGKYRDLPWFDEEVIFTDLGYFVPESRLINNDYIIEKVEELASHLEVTKEEEEYIFKEWEEGIPYEGGMNTFEALANIKLMCL